MLALAAAFAPASANAGAWIAPKGGQEIWTNVAGQRNELTFFETSAYWEAPIGEQTSFVATPWVEQNYDTLDGWRAEATLGVKRALYRGERAVMALQGGALWISHPDPECSEGGAELRWLGGVSFGETGFLNAEVATRALSGGCESERLDLTLGYRPWDNWLAMGQVFVDAPREGEESLRAQLTLVRFGESGRGIQVGLRARLDGGDAEPALVVGFWDRPEE